MIMKRKWHQIAARPRDEQAGTRLVVPAKRVEMEAPRLQALYVVEY